MYTQVRADARRMNVKWLRKICAHTNEVRAFTAAPRCWLYGNVRGDFHAPHPPQNVSRPGDFARARLGQMKIGAKVSLFQSAPFSWAIYHFFFQRVCAFFFFFLRRAEVIGERTHTSTKHSMHTRITCNRNLCAYYL